MWKKAAIKGKYFFGLSVHMFLSPYFLAANVRYNHLPSNHLKDLNKKTKYSEIPIQRMVGFFSEYTY